MQALELFAQAALNSWDVHIKRTSALFDKCSDEDLQREIAPGRNRMIYLLGHLLAVHDAMLSLLGIGERAYAHLDEAFLKNPDRAIADTPSATELRAGWNSTNAKLDDAFKKLKPEEWLQRHMSISEEDFAKEPHRNRLSVLHSRTTHLAGHFGQLQLVK